MFFLNEDNFMFLLKLKRKIQMNHCRLNYIWWSKQYVIGKTKVINLPNCLHSISFPWIELQVQCNLNMTDCILRKYKKVGNQKWQTEMHLVISDTKQGKVHSDPKAWQTLFSVLESAFGSKSFAKWIWFLYPILSNTTHWNMLL